MNKFLKIGVLVSLFIVAILVLIFFVFRVNVNTNYDYYGFVLENNFNNNKYITNGKLDNVKGLIYVKNNDKDFYNIKVDNAYLSALSISKEATKTFNHIEKDYETIDLNQFLVLIGNKIKNKRYFINSEIKVDLTSEEFINFTHIAYSYELKSDQIIVDSSNPYCLVSLDYNNVKSIKCISNNDYIKLDITNINEEFKTDKETFLNNLKDYSKDLAINPKSYKASITNLLEEIELRSHVKGNYLYYDRDNVKYRIDYDKDNNEYLTNLDTLESSMLDSDNYLKNLYTLIYSYYIEDGKLDKNKYVWINMNKIYKTLNKILVNKYEENDELVKCKFFRSGNVVMLVNCDNGLSINFSLFNDLK